jgi:twitching motility protein PilU
VHLLKELMKKSNEQGMQTFDQALYNLYKEGEITYEMPCAMPTSPNEVRLMIKLPRLNLPSRNHRYRRAGKAGSCS